MQNSPACKGINTGKKLCSAVLELRTKTHWFSVNLGLLFASCNSVDFQKTLASDLGSDWQKGP